MKSGRTPAGNSTYPKGGVSCSKDNFVVNESLVLRINICGENRHLRQARNRYLNHHPRFARVCILKSSPHTPE